MCVKFKYGWVIFNEYYSNVNVRILRDKIIVNWKWVEVNFGRILGLKVRMWLILGEWVYNYCIYYKL